MGGKITLKIKKLKEISGYRKGHIIISILTITLSVIFHNYFLNEHSTALEKLSYYGTITTFIGVVIAALEIFHSVSISTSIRDESQKLLNRYKALNKASTSSECLLILDEAHREYTKGDYETALRCFQYFRRLYLTIGYAEIELKNGNILDHCETFLHQIQHTNIDAPMSETRKKKFRDAISTLKASTEKIKHSKEE